MLKISIIETNEGVRTLRVEGRGIGPWVDEVRKCCEQSLSERKSLNLQLSDLQYADAEMVALLKECAARGVVILEAPQYILELLKSGQTSKSQTS